MALIVAENIFKLIILYQHILIFDNKNNQPKMVQTSRQTILFSTATE